MNDLTDQQLLRDYAERQSEKAFAELVRRHVDLVYSAALRMVCDSHLAQDVTQAAFLALAQNSRQLTDRPILSGWLHCTAQNIASKSVRTEVRRRAREQEAVAMNELIAHEPDVTGENIAPHLDTALGELSEPDRDVLLLRYFERKSAREMAQTLNVSEEAAQKRVNRAVERLREFFSKRNVTIGASGLVVLISTNAVQAAPIGLTVTISTAAAITGTTFATATTATVTKAIAMTTLQKTLITVTLVAAVGTGLYEARRASQRQSQLHIFEKQQAPLTKQIEQLTREREEAARQLAVLRGENERLNRNTGELLKLRNEVARLRIAEPLSKKMPADPNDPAIKNFLETKAQADQIVRYLEQMPDKKIPELKLLNDVGWLTAVKQANFDTDADIRKTLSHLRSIAKDRLPMGGALGNFIQRNNGQLPTDLSQLKPYFPILTDTPLDAETLDAILARYKLLHTGGLKDLPPDAWIIAEKAPVDKDYDSRAKFGNYRSTTISTGIGEAGDPEDKSY